MLDKLEQLKKSITAEQKKELKAAAGEDLYRLLEQALESDTNESARACLEELAKRIEKNPVKAFALYEGLTDEQKDIVTKIVDI